VVMCWVVITPAEEYKRKNRMCRLHIGVIFTKLFMIFYYYICKFWCANGRKLGCFFTKLYYYGEYWKIGLRTDTARV